MRYGEGATQKLRYAGQMIAAIGEGDIMTPKLFVEKSVAEAVAKMERALK